MINREQLIENCERGFVPEYRWNNRDSSSAQKQLGEAYALLRAGCEFKIDEINRETIYIVITSKDFAEFDFEGGYDRNYYYIPTRDLLDNLNGEDWY